MSSLALLEIADGVATITLNRPERHNALVPELLVDLGKALDTARTANPRALVLTGAGQSFSTGGDVGGFFAKAADRDELRRYADEVVGLLHERIMDLLTFPAPVIAHVNGPITGGSTGFLLAADMAVIAPTAFVQPYYGVVGFAPDGGWTALLPEKIGTAKALEVQYLNDRISAQEAVNLGLASAMADGGDAEEVLSNWTSRIARMNAGTLRATRANIWDSERLDRVSRRLNQEKQRFLERITEDEVRSGMAVFLGK